jgi:hypothetical protein
MPLEQSGQAGPDRLPQLVVQPCPRCGEEKITQVRVIQTGCALQFKSEVIQPCGCPLT